MLHLAVDGVEANFGTVSGIVYENFLVIRS